ncbi:MAG: DUF4250 domain-containing protein [Lachnospiraceae bacterium]|nr:DUF4250 domain-containing protein [Lachnospiraceae bacterium]
MSLPKDPMMLLSVTNTYLRDKYDSLDEFCSSEGVDRDYICSELKKIDYVYDKSLNKFK